MSYRPSDTGFSLNMITIFIVLGVILLVVPVTCIIVALQGKVQQKKRAEIIKNSTTRTTVQQGPNGRTVFQASSARRQSPPRSPILPMTQQQASKASRPKSMRNAWQRLSRPFSMMPAPKQDDEIELTHNLKYMPSMSRASGQDGDVSPLSPRSKAMAASSSWKTYDDLGSRTPVSPISMTNMPLSSSITGTILRGYQSHGALARKYDGMQDVPLTPPSLPPTVKKSGRGGALDLGTSRGFMSPSTLSSGRYAGPPIKTNIVDANNVKVKQIQLATPSRC